MTKLLRVDADPQRAAVVRELSDNFLMDWVEQNPGSEIIHRDLIETPIPHILSDDDIAALVTGPPEYTEATRERGEMCDEICDEIIAADNILIATPMYNHSMPSVLKAWIDHVIRVRRTFHYTDDGPVGYLKGKKALVITAMGGIYSEGVNKKNNFLEPYLLSVLDFLGIEDITFASAEGLSITAELRVKSLAKVRTQLKDLATSW